MFGVVVEGCTLPLGFFDIKTMPKFTDILLIKLNNIASFFWIQQKKFQTMLKAKTPKKFTVEEVVGSFQHCSRINLFQNHSFFQIFSTSINFENQIEAFSSKSSYNINIIIPVMASHLA